MTRIVWTAALVTVAAAGAASAQSDDFTFRRELGAGSRFVLRNIIGDVRIEPARGGTLEVRAIKVEGRHGDPDDVEIRTLDLSDGGVAICVYYPGTYYNRNDDDDRRARDEDRDDDRDDRDRPRRTRRRPSGDPCHRDGSWNGNNRNDTRVDFTVSLPPGLDVNLKTVSGDVIGRGLRGTLELGTVSGNLHLTDVQATVLDAASVSGDVELVNVDAREVTAQTVSGDVTYSGLIARDGAYDFQTLSGDVELTLPREPDARLRGSTFSGRLYSDLPTTRDAGRRGRRRSRFDATWGSGSATIDVESFSGNVRIQTRGGR